MKKGIILFLFFIFLMFVNTNIVSAFFFSYNKAFAGKINNTKATEIQQWESAGYICPVFGSTISITPIGSPSNTPRDYFIPSYIISKTRSNISSGKLILGKYSGKTTITCILEAEVPLTQVVMLDTINLFGTSR